MYKSTDGGKTWTHIGLNNTQHIARVLVHPRNPDLVYVAALGHAYGPNPDRGVFRSADGGKTWEKILFKDDKTGAIDLAFDPHNSNVLFAALWEGARTPWSMSSGGPGSGLYKSIDGGNTWKHLEGKGLPSGIARTPGSNRHPIPILQCAPQCPRVAPYLPDVSTYSRHQSICIDRCPARHYSYSRACAHLPTARQKERWSY